MKIGILTSSRADFGVYLPLIKILNAESFFNSEIIAFGAHLSNIHGNTVQEIEDMGFSVSHKLNTAPDGDKPIDISMSISKTIASFSEFWANNNYDLVFALGDRYEMMSAVLAGSPYNIRFAHIHAGETTLGAIDNSFRHSISLMSEVLFVSTEEYRMRAIEITQHPEHVYNVGALSVDNLIKTDLLSINEFGEKYSIDLSQKTILITFHPETVGYERNEYLIKELLDALSSLLNKYQLLITMPNSDTSGLMIRKKLESFGEKNRRAIVVENLGMMAYLSAMKHCSFLLGNTSSAFVEAAYFPKWVINLGNRQDGRIITPNIQSIPVEKNQILKAVEFIEKQKSLPSNCNIYGKGDTAQKISRILKSINNL